MKLKSIALTLSLLLALAPFPAGQQVFAQLTNETANADYVKSLDDLTLHDDTRNKDLHVRVTYPQKTEPLPVIIFSHGAGGSKDSYAYLADYWAKDGFIVIQPTHADSIGKPSNVIQGIKKLMDEVHKLPTDYEGWNNRLRDISFVIDSLPAIQKATGVQADDTRIGVGGHSYGAFASVIIGGGKVPTAATSAVKTSQDSRVKAILVISPQAIRTGNRGFGFDDKTAWQNVNEPAMYMTGTFDQTGLTKAADRREAYVDSPPPEKYFVVIEGANHMTFAGRNTPLKKASEGAEQNSAATPDSIKPKSSAPKGILGLLSRRFGPPEKGDHEQMLSAIQVVTAKFWDAYLKNDESALAAIKKTADGSLGSLVEIESK